MRHGFVAAAASVALAAFVVLVVVGLHGSAVRIFFGVLFACCLIAAATAWATDRRAQRALPGQIEGFVHHRTQGDDDHGTDAR